MVMCERRERRARGDVVYGWAVISRTATRSLTVLAAAVAWTAASVVATVPALATGTVPPEGSEPPESLTLVETLGLFVAAPLALFALIALAVLGPSIGRSSRHRTGASLEVGPVWVGHGGTEPVLGDPGTAELTSGPGERGGASGRW